MNFTPVPIALTQCSKTFHGTRVLEPLDLSIGAGETLVLLGPSGCGKTTTLRIIAGLESPDAGGTVRFGDEDVTHLPIERRHVGMVFQSYALFPNLTVRGNVGYGLKIAKTDPGVACGRGGGLVSLVWLDGHADKTTPPPPGGQRQRVALARALAREPRVLLLDEPLTALDARLRDTLRREMNTLLRGLGVTTVYVTHDQAEAMELGDRIVVMGAGRIEQIGTPRDIYYRPANRAVAQFVGTINRLEGHVPNGTSAIAGGNGNKSELFFRPEDGRLVHPQGASLRGVVETVSFLGERTRVTVSGAAPEALVIDVPGRSEWAPGAAVGIEIAPEGLIALP